MRNWFKNFLDKYAEGGHSGSAFSGEDPKYREAKPFSEEESGNMTGQTAVIRKYMKIYGDVQGVGFRYRANYAASGLGITGWVRNCFDGTVEMEVQGTEEQINRMMVTINRGSYISIDRIWSEIRPVEPDESGFSVRY